MQITLRTISYCYFKTSLKSTKEMYFTLPMFPKKIARSLIFLTLIFIFISFAGQLSLYFLPDFPGRDILIEEFNVDEEANFPSLYSTLLLLGCAILLGIIAKAKKRERDRYSFHWQFLSLIFVYLSLDELLSLHEYLAQPLKRSFGFSGFLYHAWVVPAIILLLVFFLSFTKFFFALPPKTRFLVLIAAMLYVSGSLGMEILGGKYADWYGEENLVYQIFVTIEESLEMLGMVAFLYALLMYIKRTVIGKIHAIIDFNPSNEVNKKIEVLMR
jgi:hypothetical protein